jgi:hypothetical protein
MEAKVSFHLSQEPATVSYSDSDTANSTIPHICETHFNIIPSFTPMYLDLM